MTMTQTARPRGRRPGHDDTKGTIARCAQTLFDRHGYDATSLRAIAREADVDPALVHHYFSTKARLFSSLVSPTLDLTGPFDALGDLPPEQQGVRLARTFLDVWEPSANRAAVHDFLSTGLGYSHERLLGEFLAREVFCRFAVAAGHANAALRAQLAASALLGIVIGRHTIGMGALSTAGSRTLVDPLGGLLQHLLVDPW